MGERRLLASIVSGFEESEPTLELWLVVGAGTGGDVKVKLIGEVCTDSVPEASDVLWRASADCASVVLDLAAVTFFDCRGVAMLIELRQGLEARGATLEVANPSPAVRQVLQLTELDRVFMTELQGSSADSRGRHPRRAPNSSAQFGGRPVGGSAAAPATHQRGSADFG